MDNHNFAAALKQYITVDMKPTVQTAYLRTSQQKLAFDSNTLAWH